MSEVQGLSGGPRGLAFSYERVTPVHAPSPFWASFAASSLVPLRLLDLPKFTCWCRSVISSLSGSFFMPAALRCHVASDPQ